MKKAYIILLSVILCSCHKKDGFFYIEYEHKNGSKYVNLIHSDLKCENVNAALNRIDDWAGVNYYYGYCNKCVTSKEITETDERISKAKYNKESLDALLSLLEMSRVYFSEVDTIPDKELIQLLMIDAQKNIELIYDKYKDGYKFYRTDINARKLLKMDKTTFLIRVKRWAEYYVKDRFFLVTDEKWETKKDLRTYEGDDDEA